MTPPQPLAFASACAFDPTLHATLQMRIYNMPKVHALVVSWYFDPDLGITTQPDDSITMSPQVILHRSSFVFVTKVLFFCYQR